MKLKTTGFKEPLAIKLLALEETSGLYMLKDWFWTSTQVCCKKKMGKEMYIFKLLSVLGKCHFWKLYWESSISYCYVGNIINSDFVNNNSMIFKTWKVPLFFFLRCFVHEQKVGKLIAQSQWYIASFNMDLYSFLTLYPLKQVLLWYEVFYLLHNILFNSTHPNLVSFMAI